jgi:hypothetical protein
MAEVALFPATELGERRKNVRVSPYAQRRATFDEAVRWGGRGSFAGWDANLQAEREAVDARHGVVLAAGGYENNAAQVRDYEGLRSSVSSPTC